MPRSSPNYVARLFAIVFLVAMAPVLLFAGYCGIAGIAIALAPIGLGIFAGVAVVTYHGVRALWHIRESPEGTGWIIALVLLALLAGAIALWISQIRCC